MLFHHPADRVLQRTRDKLVLQGNRQHDQLIFIAAFEFCHGFLFRLEPCSIVLDSPTFSTVSTAGVTGGWGEPSSETEACHSSETTPKNAPSPSRPVHAVLGVFLSQSQRSVLRYFNPESANNTAIVLPLQVVLSNCTATATLAPEEKPAKIPSSLARRRVKSIASSSVTLR